MQKSVVKLYAVAGLSFFIAMNCFSAEKKYKGTVVPFMVASLNVGSNGAYRGTIQDVARKNSIILPAVRNEKTGDLIDGDMLVQMKPDYFKADVLSFQGKVDELKGNLVATEQIYIRSTNLAKRNVISQETYQEDRQKYYDNVYQLEQAKNQLVQAKVMLKYHTVYAPFPAKVTNVFIPGGLCATIPAVVEISQLNPVWVTVKMPRDEARKIDFTTPVTIIAKDGTKLGVIHGYGRLCDDGYQFAVYNKPAVNAKVNIDGKEAYAVTEWHDVLQYYGDTVSNKILCVPSASLDNDEKGFFVYKAEDVKNSQPSESIKQLTKVTKVYINPSKVSQQLAGCINFTLLKDSGTLKPFDIVISGDVTDNLKEGDYIYLTENRFEIMPSDELEVLIGDK